MYVQVMLKRLLHSDVEPHQCSAGGDDSVERNISLGCHQRSLKDCPSMEYSIMSLAFQFLFAALLFGLPGFGIASSFTAGRPWFIRVWSGVLCSVAIFFVLFLASGLTGSLPMIAGWLR